MAASGGLWTTSNGCNAGAKLPSMAAVSFRWLEACIQDATGTLAQRQPEHPHDGETSSALSVRQRLALECHALHKLPPQSPAVPEVVQTSCHIMRNHPAEARPDVAAQKLIAKPTVPLTP
jgi:hypothetical protein